MVTEHFFENFEELQSLTKTLRFQLRSIGKTAEYIKVKGLMEKDKTRAQYYPIVKETADDFYRQLIDRQLSGLSFDFSELAKAQKEYNQASSKNKEDCSENLNAVREKYRVLLLSRLKGETDETGQRLPNKIANANRTRFDSYFKADLINKVLPAFAEENYTADEKEAKLKAIRYFFRFTTYFSNFYTARENVFKTDDIPTAIQHRLIDHNFPIFLQNCAAFAAAQDRLRAGLAELEEAMQKKGLLSEDEPLAAYFSVDGYNRVCHQHGIDIYNSILGGFFIDEDTKIKGFNELVNLHNQAETKRKKQGQEQRGQIYRMTRLAKQILSYSDSSSYLIDQIEGDEDLYNRLFEYCQFMTEGMEKGESVLDAYEQLYIDYEDTDPAKLWVDAKYLNQLSHKLCSKWDALQIGLLLMSDTTKDPRLSRYLKCIDLSQDLGDLKIPIYFSLAELDEAFALYCGTEQKALYESSDFSAVFRDQRSLKQEFIQQSDKIKQLHGEQKSLLGNAEAIVILKDFLDSMLAHYHKWQYLACDATELRDPNFYAQFDQLMDDFSQIKRLYNLCRNYLTRKPSAVNKFRLTFNVPTLADGWSESKVEDNNCTLFRKDGCYYLGIIDHRKVYRELLAAGQAARDSGSAYYERMEYNYFPGANKMIPKCSFVKQVKEHFASENKDEDYLLDSGNFIEPLRIPAAIYKLQFEDLYDNKRKYQIDYLRRSGDEAGYRAALTQWINFCKSFLRVYKGTAVFDHSSLRKADEYASLSEFYNDLDCKNYQVKWSQVPAALIDKLVDDGQLYLFRLYTKDFSPHSKGKANLHTLYWHALFSEENAKLNRLKLAGNAELFKRPQQIKKAKRHKKGSILLNHHTKDGEAIPTEIFDELFLYLNHQAQDELSAEAEGYLKSGRLVYHPAQYDIIKDRRYTEDRYFFHVPLQFNWTVGGAARINDLCQSYIASRDDMHIIGIDRGERHLLYYSVINLQGEIIEQGSLNELTQQDSEGRERSVDYHNLLQTREAERAAARVNWRKIDQIKDLKEGYLSHVVHKLSKLIIRYNAVLIMENLNVGFKRGRFKVERQVYQKFESALMNKLSALSFKEIPLAERGSVLRPWQLTMPASDYDVKQSQNGIIFYVPASYTSQTDPRSGFINLFPFKRIRGAERETFLDHLSGFSYDQAKDMFVFTFDYSLMEDYCLLSDTPGKQWEAYTNGTRLRFDPEKREMVEVDLTGELKRALAEAGIPLTAEDLWQEAKALPEGAHRHRLISQIFYIFRLTLQMRNSDQHDDYILSPILSADGTFFDSRKAGPTEPCDGDANGAYHIAKKGLILCKRIKGLAGSQGQEKKPSLVISNLDWYEEVNK